MVRAAARCLRPGGRLVGVRECLDSKARGPAPPSADASRGPLRFAYSLLDSTYGMENAELMPREPHCFKDFCQCKFEFGNSDGSSMQFQSFVVHEATMLDAFAEAGLVVQDAGPRLSFDAVGAMMFDAELQNSYLDSYGKLMWYFDAVKPPQPGAKH
eukprot:SAG31_NODE_5297_length_2625_cov_2.764450_3_plen_157_part_00